MLEKRHPGVPMTNVPDGGAVALILRTKDLNAAIAASTGGGHVVGNSRVTVPATAANGVILVFEA